MEKLINSDDEVAYDLFLTIGKKQKDSTVSKLFGKPCFTFDGKSYMLFFQCELVVKLKGLKHTDATKLQGAKLFDPSGKGRAMKEWVQIPFQHKSKWTILANIALAECIAGK